MNLKLQNARSRMIRHAIWTFGAVLLVSCASLKSTPMSLPPRMTGSDSLVILNLYRMNNIIGTDIEARFRLLNVTTGVIYPAIEPFPRDYYVGSLKVVPVPPGEYKVKYVEFRSVGQGVQVRLDCEQKTKQFTVKGNSIVYIGNIGIDNGNRDLFRQKYDLIRMGKPKADSDLDLLKGVKWRGESEWGSQTIIESDVFPELIENTR